MGEDEKYRLWAPTVTGAITAVGPTISMVVRDNPTKVLGSDKFLPALQIMIEGCAKDDPPTQKMLPIESDVPQLLVDLGYSTSGTSHTQAVGDLILIAFYYLLRIGEYTVKSKRSNTKQTVQFKLEDVTFYKKRNWDSFVASQKMRLTNSFCLPIAQPLSLTTRKTDGKGCVCIRKRMARQSIAQFGRSAGESSTFVNREQRSQLSYLRFIMRGRSMMSLAKP